MSAFGKLAEDITDEKTWRAICRDLAKGLVELIAIMQPEAIVLGGSVGNFFDRYDKILKEEVKKYEVPLVPMPHLLKAANPKEAVIYGCFLLARQKFSVGERASVN